MGSVIGIDEPAFGAEPTQALETKDVDRAAAFENGSEECCGVWAQRMA
jgi:hypothetical protein